MPKGCWGHGNIRGAQFRETDRLFPELERTPDLSRGNIRLASEALLASRRGERIPKAIMAKALAIAVVMARG